MCIFNYNIEEILNLLYCALASDISVGFQTSLRLLLQKKLINGTKKAVTRCFAKNEWKMNQNFIHDPKWSQIKKKRSKVKKRANKHETVTIKKQLYMIHKYMIKRNRRIRLIPLETQLNVLHECVQYIERIIALYIKKKSEEQRRKTKTKPNKYYWQRTELKLRTLGQQMKFETIVARLTEK